MSLARPTASLVAIAWLSLHVPELLGGDIVGTGLPSDVTKWADTGFLQVSMLPSGSPNVDIPVRKPIVQLDAWATGNRGANASSTKPQWNLAGQLLEAVREATEDAQTGFYGRAIDVKTNYRQARVQAVYLVSEPMVVDDDPSGYARFTADLAVDWVPA